MSTQQSLVCRINRYYYNNGIQLIHSRGEKVNQDPVLSTTNSLFMPSVTDDSKVLMGFHLKELRVTGCEVQWQTIPKQGTREGHAMLGLGNCRALFLHGARVWGCTQKLDMYTCT